VGPMAEVIATNSLAQVPAEERMGHSLQAFDGAALIPWVVSGRDEAGLREQAARLAGFVAGADEELATAAVGQALVAGRAVFEERAVVLGAGRAAMVDGLRALAGGVEALGVVSGTALGGAGPVWVFPGQGPQWIGMALELLGCSPVFAAAMARCGRALDRFVDWDLGEVLAGDGAELGRVDVVQPVLWAVMVSLAELWRAVGVVPAAVVGHSLGEIAAACVAGALSLEDAACVVALQSRAIVSLAGTGGMVSVCASAERVEKILAEFDGSQFGDSELGDSEFGGGPGVAVAAVNGPESVVVSGPAEGIEAFLVCCAEQGVQARRVAVDYPLHSVHVAGLEREIVGALSGISPQAPKIPMFSTVTGRWVVAGQVTAEYWFENLRRQVRFADAITALGRAGHRVFIECSAHPVLTIGVQDTLDAADLVGMALGTLCRDEGGPDRFLSSVAQAFVYGVAVDWARLIPRAHSGPIGAARPIDLPGSGSQRQDHRPPARQYGAGDLAGAGLGPVDHGFLGAAVTLAGGDGLLLTGRIDLRAQPWLADHVLDGVVTLAGAAFLELVLRAAELAGAGSVEELAIEAPLLVPEHGCVYIQVKVAAADEAGRCMATVYSQTIAAEGNAGDAGTPWLGADQPWVRHVAATLAGLAVDKSGPMVPSVPEGFAEVDFSVWPPIGTTVVDTGGFYPAMAELGYGLGCGGGHGYGPTFQGLRAVWRRGDELFAEVELPAASRADAARFDLHPALLDAALHAIGLGGLIDAGVGSAGGVSGFVSSSFNQVTLHATGADMLRVRLRKVASDAVELLAADERGGPVVTVGRLVMRPVALETPVRAANSIVAPVTP
jgi:acyl transferase domain-containing protein